MNRLQKINNIESQFIRDNLIEEYGYLLPFLQNCNFYVIEISPNDILFGQEVYFNSLTEDKIRDYKEFQGIMGIVKQVDDKFRVIDGYHRLKANLNQPLLKVILAK